MTASPGKRAKYHRPPEAPLLNTGRPPINDRTEEAPVARLKMVEDKDPSPDELGKHLGEWVAVYGGRIIAHGTNPERVLGEAAKKTPPAKDPPMIYRVPKRNMLLY
jgi:hypothetical protein